VELDLELFGEEGLVVPQRLVSVDIGSTREPRSGR
jgi:hypothetical protein